jgi:hypothetical protein
MTIKEQLHQLLDELDEDSAEEARAYLQSPRAVQPRRARTDDVTATEAEHAAAMGVWEDEGGRPSGTRCRRALNRAERRTVTHTC